LIGVLLCGTSAASAASFDCNAHGLSRTEAFICRNSQLSRTDERLARKADLIARRMNFGQYLGLRHWQATSAKERDLCGSDQACLNAHYRSQSRLLDRLQQCLDTRFARRSCLRNTLAGNRAAVR
jgi:uncharacterized protein